MYQRKYFALFGFCCLYRYFCTIPECKAQGFIQMYCYQFYGGMPWVSINQTNAIAYSQNVEHCDGCHLISEAEWMTIAQNVLSVPANWSGNAVGNGYIYSGHNDGDPTGALVATTNDSDDYFNTGNGISSGPNQRRTLTLTNGEVVWDLVGNVWEWTSGQTNGTTAQQPGITGTGWDWREWTAITANGSLLINPSPTSTDLSGANTWDSSKGIGQINSNSDSTGLYGFIRGGAWYSSSSAGVLVLHLGTSSGFTGGDVGFRVSR